MSALKQILNARSTYARQWKIAWWTLGMAVGVFLITDGKTTLAVLSCICSLGPPLVFYWGLFSLEISAQNKTIELSRSVRVPALDCPKAAMNRRTPNLFGGTVAGNAQGCV